MRFEAELHTQPVKITPPGVPAKVQLKNFSARPKMRQNVG
jgi:hypothetical protein